MKKLALPLLLFLGIAGRVAITVAMNAGDNAVYATSTACRNQPDSTLRVANSPAAMFVSLKAEMPKP